MARARERAPVIAGMDGAILATVQGVKHGRHRSPRQVLVGQKARVVMIGNATFLIGHPLPSFYQRLLRLSS